MASTDQGREFRVCKVEKSDGPSRCPRPGTSVLQEETALFLLMKIKIQQQKKGSKILDFFFSKRCFVVDCRPSEKGASQQSRSARRSTGSVRGAGAFLWQPCRPTIDVGENSSTLSLSPTQPPLHTRVQGDAPTVSRCRGYTRAHEQVQRLGPRGVQLRSTRVWWYKRLNCVLSPHVVPQTHAAPPGSGSAHTVAAVANAMNVI